MGILTETYKENPIENKFLPPIDFNSIQDVPESHAWVETNGDSKTLNYINNNNIIINTSENLTSIPVIDLNGPNVLEKIYNACKNWGFLHITNHGVPTEMLEKVETQVMKLFKLPFEEKMKVLRAPDSAAGYGSPRLSPYFPKKMWTEGFTIMGDSLVPHAKLLWPQNGDDYNEFCEVMVEYQAQMKILSEKLLALIYKSLNIPESEMTWAEDDPNRLSTALQMNSYPICPDPANTMGLARHTDSFLLTIVHQTGNISGLQMYKDDLGWVPIDPVPGGLVVNSGDLLHIISNGRFPSVLHRAVVNNKVHRISVAYFYGPAVDIEVSPYVGYPNCDGPRYKSVTAREYVGIKSKLLESTLASIRIN